MTTLRNPHLQVLSDEPTIHTGAIDKHLLTLNAAYTWMNDFIQRKFGKIRLRIGSTWFTVSHFRVIDSEFVEAEIEALGIVDDSVVIRFRDRAITPTIYPGATDDDFIL